MLQILSTLKIDEPFFHIPNQLWAHKNHSVVIEALKILKAKGNCPLVISTGFTEDYRNPSYFPALLKDVEAYGLTDHIRFLGLIEYEQVATLMRKSVALINPSLFEGWSTTVEEAKSLGKKILLSDIPVHKEQSPGRGEFFPTNGPEKLAELITQSMNVYDDSIEEEFYLNAEKKLTERIVSFGRTYESIVMDIIRQ
jgi:glycosyltransferase involved in cell wall biosynthesis